MNGGSVGSGVGSSGAAGVADRSEATRKPAPIDSATGARLPKETPATCSTPVAPSSPNTKPPTSRHQRRTDGIVAPARVVEPVGPDAVLCYHASLRHPPTPSVPAAPAVECRHRLAVHLGACHALARPPAAAPAGDQAVAPGRPRVLLSAGYALAFRRGAAGAARVGAGAGSVRRRARAARDPRPLPAGRRARSGAHGPAGTGPPAGCGAAARG